MNAHYLTKRFKYQSSALRLSSMTLILGSLIYLSRDVTCLPIYLFGFGIFSVLTTFHRIRNTHIVVSEKGIEYHSPWMIVETKWERIQKISYYWYGGLRVECLLVDNSQALIQKWSFPERYPPSPFGGPFSQQTIFPVSCFADNWRASELGQHIKQYAPHLFVDKQSEIT